MTSFGELVMIETNGTEEMDMGIGLSSNAGLVLREDGKILSPDSHVNSLGKTVPAGDVINTIREQIRNALDSADSQAVDEMSEQIEERILEMADSTYDSFTELLEEVLYDVADSGFEILNSVDITKLAQMISEALIHLLQSSM